MSTPSLSLGYVILTVKDVASSLAFYEAAFGLTRRFLHDENGFAYGELETGATRLAFINAPLATSSQGAAPVLSSPTAAPLGVEIAFTTTQVNEAYAKALQAGATAQRAPETKPWGQVVSYVRDPDGHLVEICSPMP